MKFLLLFVLSTFTYAISFNISHEVVDCNISGDQCEVRVEFSVTDSDFLYINSCYDIDPNSDELQFCIEDLEVRANRMYNNQ